jgi:hypothetical protein
VVSEALRACCSGTIVCRDVGWCWFGFARRQQQPCTFKMCTGGQRIRWGMAIARQQQQPHTFKMCAGGQRIPQRGGHSATATTTTHVPNVCRGSAHPGDMATVRRQQQPCTFGAYTGGQCVPQGGGGHSVTATAATHVQDVRRGSTHPVGRGHSATATTTMYVRDTHRGSAQPATNDNNAAA